MFPVDPDKNHSSLKSGAEIVPWLSPWLEKGEFREERIDEKDYVQLFVVDGLKVAWAEKSKISYRSDADWTNFTPIAETGAFKADGFADDDSIDKLTFQYDKNKDGLLEKSELPQDAQKKLRKLIVNYPSEWDGSDNSKKYERITKNSWKGQKLSSADFEKFKNHLKRIQFWQETQAVAKLPESSTLWHPHPIAFIEHLAKCMWLSEPELEAIFPTTPKETREFYRIPINKCTLKFCISNRFRIGHLLGQSAIESAKLTDMLEGNDQSTENSQVMGIKTFKDYEKNTQTLGNVFRGDGFKFRGRGLKQLTGRFNTTAYLEFIGATKGGVQNYHAKADWWGADGWPKYNEDDDLSSIDPIAHKNRPPRILIDVNDIQKKSFLAIEAGVYFWILNTGIYKLADENDSNGVSKIVNRYATGTFDQRKEDTSKIIDITT